MLDWKFRGSSPKLVKFRTTNPIQVKPRVVVGIIIIVIKM